MEEDEYNKIEKVIHGEFRNANKRNNEENLYNIEKKFDEIRNKK